MSDLSWLNPTPHAIAVYASRPPSPVATQHSLPSGRYSLLGPDFHRLDRTSFAWRTQGHDVSKDFAVRAIDCFHARLVPVPGEMDFVEAHGFDDAGVVRGIETVDLETGRLRHGLQERFPILLLIQRGFGRD